MSRTLSAKQTLAGVSRRTLQGGAHCDTGGAIASALESTTQQCFGWKPCRPEELPLNRQAASLLPGGSLGLIWSGGAHPDDLANALETINLLITWYPGRADVLGDESGSLLVGGLDSTLMPGILAGVQPVV